MPEFRPLELFGGHATEHAPLPPKVQPHPSPVESRVERSQPLGRDQADYGHADSAEPLYPAAHSSEPHAEPVTSSEPHPTPEARSHGEESPPSRREPIEKSQLEEPQRKIYDERTAIDQEERAAAVAREEAEQASLATKSEMENATSQRAAESTEKESSKPTTVSDVVKAAVEETLEEKQQREAYEESQREAQAFLEKYQAEQRQNAQLVEQSRRQSAENEQHLAEEQRRQTASDVARLHESERASRHTAGEARGAVKQHDKETSALTDSRHNDVQLTLQRSVKSDVERETPGDPQRQQDETAKRRGSQSQVVIGATSLFMPPSGRHYQRSPMHPEATTAQAA